MYIYDNKKAVTHRNNNKSFGRKTVSMSAFSQLEKLSEKDKLFLTTKQIEDEKSADDWLNFFNRIKQFDQIGDKTRQKNFGLGCVAAILLVFGIFVSPILFSFSLEAGSFAFSGIVSFLIILIFLALLAATIFGFVRYKKLKKFDIQVEMLTDKVLPILLILQEEMKPNDLIKLRLDLRGFEIPEKLVSQSNDYGSGMYRSIVDYYYRDPWIDGTATLGDGTRLIWHIQDLVKHIKKVKWRKGKRKSKSKHRTFLNFQIGMHRKKHSLPVRLKLKGNEGKLRTKRSGAYHWMNVYKTIKHPPGQQFSPNDFVNAIASAYVRATPQRRK